MTVIHKQQLRVIRQQSVSMSKQARTLCVQLQNGIPTIWYETDEHPVSEREIIMVGTGHEVPDIKRRYLGTIQLDSFVWHFYEVEK